MFLPNATKKLSQKTNMKRKVKLGKYRHYKGGEYKVIGVAKHSETLEELVIYTHDDEFWVRPKKMFLGNVNKNGEIIPRFKYIKNEKIRN